MKDILGNEIKVGDFIAYALSIDRSAEIAVYKVMEVHDKSMKVQKLLATYTCNNKYTWTTASNKKPSNIFFCNISIVITSLVAERDFSNVDNNK